MFSQPENVFSAWRGVRQTYIDLRTLSITFERGGFWLSEFWIPLPPFRYCSLFFYPAEYWEEISPINLKSRTWMLPVDILQALWRKDEAQDIAEYAVMLAVILVILIGTIRLIGSNSNNVFSRVSSSLQ
jgi:Flp pilus assembly pilin Flp